MARMGRTHGLDGSIFVDQLSLTPDELEQIDAFVWRDREGKERPLRLRTARVMGHRVVVRFAGIETKEDAQALVNGELRAERDRVPDAGPGQAYTFQLVGLRMVDTRGREIGVVKDILRTGAHPVYVVAGAREILVPSSGPIVQRVDLEAGVITVDLPEGLEEL